MKFRNLSSLLVAILTIGVFSSRAIAAKCECVPSARLIRVVEGTFALKMDDSIDLTNGGVLLSFLGGRDRWYKIRINGQEFNSQIGARFNLKKFTSRLNGRDECWLDFLRVIEAKGAPLTASFRLDCP